MKYIDGGWREKDKNLKNINKFHLKKSFIVRPCLKQKKFVQPPNQLVNQNFFSWKSHIDSIFLHPGRHLEEKTFTLNSIPFNLHVFYSGNQFWLNFVFSSRREKRCFVYVACLFNSDGMLEGIHSQWTWENCCSSSASASIRFLETLRRVCRQINAIVDVVD